MLKHKRLILLISLAFIFMPLMSAFADTTKYIYDDEIDWGSNLKNTLYKIWVSMTVVFNDNYEAVNPSVSI